MKILKCDKCGKVMTMEPSGIDVWKSKIYGKEINYPTSISAISITFSISENESEGYRKLFKHQVGKYEIGRTYNFCCECWLDSLMCRNQPSFQLLVEDW